MELLSGIRDSRLLNNPAIEGRRCQTNRDIAVDASVSADGSSPVHWHQHARPDGLLQLFVLDETWPSGRRPDSSLQS
jgi:hypothetical protein